MSVLLSSTKKGDMQKKKIAILSIDWILICKNVDFQTQQLLSKVLSLDFP